MTSAEVFKHYKAGTVGEMYKTFLKVFELIDKWADTFTNSNLLDENELALSMDQLSGCYAKLNPVAGALEAIMAETEHDSEVKEYNALGEKVRIQDCSIVRAKARHSVADLRRYKEDFSRYCWSANTMITTAQSRLKRLTVEKGAKGVGYTGETPVQGTGKAPEGWVK